VVAVAVLLSQCQAWAVAAVAVVLLSQYQAWAVAAEEVLLSQYQALVAAVVAVAKDLAVKH
jgi:hypothetical protein